MSGTIFDVVAVRARVTIDYFLSVVSDVDLCWVLSARFSGDHKCLAGKVARVDRNP